MLGVSGWFSGSREVSVDGFIDETELLREWSYGNQSLGYRLP